jgi:hypothetical protein
LKPYAALFDDTSDPKTLALTLSACEDMTCLLAVGHLGRVVIGHHLLYDMRTPFALDRSDQLIMLTGRHTMDNPIGTTPTLDLWMQQTRNFTCPTWDDLAAATDGAAVKALPLARNGPKYPGSPRPLLPIPAWLAAPLMEAGTDDAATLCLVAIQAIRDFDTRATTSPAAAAALATTQRAMDTEAVEETKEDEEGVPPLPVRRRRCFWAASPSSCGPSLPRRSWDVIL